MNRELRKRIVSKASDQSVGLRVHHRKYKAEPPLTEVIFQWGVTLGVCLALWTVIAPLFHESVVMGHESGVVQIATFIIIPMGLVLVFATRRVIVKTHNHYFPPANTADLPLPKVWCASQEPLQAKEAVLLRAASEGAETQTEPLLRAATGKK